MSLTGLVASSSAMSRAIQANQWRFFLSALMLTDALMLMLAFSLAYWLRFHVHVTLEPDVLPPAGFYPQLILLLIPTWLLLFAAFRLYDPILLLGGTEEYACAFNACTSGMMIVVLITFLEPRFIVARAWLVMAWLFTASFVLAARFLLRRFIYTLRKRGHFTAQALIVGINEEALALGTQLQASRGSGIHVMGYIATTTPTTLPASALPIVGTLDELEKVLQVHGVHKIIVAMTALDREQLHFLYDRLTNFPVLELHLSSGLFEVLTTGLQVRTVGAIPLVTLKRLRLEPLELLLKALMDYLLTLGSLVLLLPVLTIIALLIRLDSPGPIFHRRRVLGVHGKPFDAFKFRTMYINGDEILARNPELLLHLQQEHKLKDDPRITKVGHRLRRYSLDELPQLFNVILGQMSLVGPRMISQAEGVKYGRLLTNLLTVKPGLTGLWQVSGRSDISYEERVLLDMHYIRNYSIWQDIQILFVQTLPAVIKGRGAY